MARHNRIQTPGLIRHVMSRGNGRMTIFLDDTDFRKFVYILGDVVETFSIKCWSFCVMSNHYHATLQPSRANLSEAIRQLNGAYAQWWNKRHARVGHTFQGRFKDQIVQRDDGYLLALIRYVEMNPVRARLVERPEDWRWSSYSAIAGLTSCPAFLDAAATLRLFGDDVRVQRARFAEFVTVDPDDTIADRIRSSERILGDRSFKASFTEETCADFEVRTNVQGDSAVSEAVQHTLPAAGV
jgi:REP-associated tyrosine transposase